MNIIILGKGCSKCKVAEQLVRETLQRHKIKAEVIHEYNLMKIAEYGPVTTPAVVVDGKVRIQGHVPTEAEILGAIGR
ncbi:MAG: thioredoxin family protein [Nanoarchaeota archaeon]